MKTSLLISAALLTLACGARGGGTVTNLTQADLETALQGGGTVVFTVNGTLALTNPITITQDTTLDSYGSSVTISGGSAVRLFQVTTNVQFLVRGLVLANGSVVGTNAPDSDPTLPGGDALGAAVLNRGGNLMLADCTLTNHSVQGGNASLSAQQSAAGNGGNGFGAAICSLGGILSLTNCSVSNNQAAGGFANGVSPFVNVATYSGSAWGGAIYAEQSKVTLVNVTFESSRATGAGWGTSSFLAGRCGDGSGGALFATNSQVTITGCSFRSNSASGGSSSIYNVGQGGGCGYGLGGAVFLSEDSSAQIQLSQFTSNSVAGGNGPHNNTAGAGQGGAIFNAGNLQVSASTFAQGLAYSGYGSYSGTAGQGGAIFSSRLLGLDGCSFIANLAIGGGPGPLNSRAANGEGGAVWATGGLNASNSTFALNAAVGGQGGITVVGAAAGGGLLVTNGSASLVNVTFASNGAYATNMYPTQPAGSAQGGNVFSTNSVVTVRNSILADNNGGGDVWGGIIDGGYNICSDGTAQFSAMGSLNEADPMLSALSQNGGPTPTIGLLAGSPARDAIPSGFPPVDQRGVSRPQGPAADIGAFEADFISSSPAIVTQPIGGTFRAGTNVTLTVEASGTTPLSYQWFKNGTSSSGATQSSLSLSNVQAVDSATYSALVTNIFGTEVSQGAVLVVDSKPLILVQPVGSVIAPGGSAQFSVSADGPALAYQWWHDSTALLGASSNTLAIGSALAGAQGDYFVIVTNFAGSVTSAPALLRFDSSALNILVPPKDQTTEAGYPATFSVLVSGIPPFAYQWQHNGTALAGATNSALTLPSASANDAGSYSVIVTNGYSSVASTGAQLTVTAGAKPPALAVGRFGQNLTITFTAEAGRSYRLLGSTNLVSWAALATNSAVAAGPLQFVQSIKPIPGAFFRVVTP